MAKKFYETNEFKKLSQKWDAKLKEVGFVDIECKSEKTDGVIRPQRWEYNPVRHFYYEKCWAHFNSTSFRDDLDEHIFKFYCEGLSTRAIMRELFKTTGKTTSQMTVVRRINRILADAGIEQLI